ncbi:hypothetical protein P7C70_g4413, partial [Phenoliferia sp. Uapishka_3]
MVSPILTEPMERPYNPDGSPQVGKRGQLLKLELNTFQIALDIDGRPMTVDDDVAWFQYNVVILAVKRKRWTEKVAETDKPAESVEKHNDEPEKSVASVDAQASKENSITQAEKLDTTLPPKKKLRSVWAQLEDSGVFGDIKPVYDGRNIAYSTKPLALEKVTNYVLDTKDDGKFLVTLNDPIKLTPSELVKWCTGSGTSHTSDVFSCLAALNTLFSHGPGLLLPTNKTTFFINQPGKFGGFFQAVRAASNELYLNIDTTTGAFVQSGNLAIFLTRFFGNNSFKVLNPHDRVRIHRVIKHAAVTIDLGGSRPPKHRKLGVGLTLEDARSRTFKLDNDVEISIEDYFKKTYAISLKYPHYPCVEIKPGLVYPLELVSLKEGNRYLKKLDSEQQLSASSFQTLRPSERLKAIIAISSSQTLSAPYLPQFGVIPNVQPRKVRRPLTTLSSLLSDTNQQVLGRLLEPPTIDYQVTGSQRIQARVAAGAWRMDRGRTKLHTGTTIKSFAIIASVRPDRSGAVMQTMVDILHGCEGLAGLYFPAPPKQNVVVINDSRQTVEETLHRSLELGGNAFGSKPEIIFWIFDIPNDRNYHTFKEFGKSCGAEQCGLGLTFKADNSNIFIIKGYRNGILTQALQSRNVQPKKAKDFQFMINMSLKMNAKNRGLNHVLARNVTGPQAGWLDLHPAVVFGAPPKNALGKDADVVASRCGPFALRQ